MAETLGNVGQAVQAPKAPQGKARRQEPDGPAVDDRGHVLDGGREAKILWFRVLEDCEVPSQSGRFILKRGKILSTKEYDPEKLKDAGVKLEPAEEPAWHRKLQATGRSLAR